ncbi:MAG: hypothetical protein ACI8W7_000019 [Gammaproteobacteria bacterium]|jgi:hypothetical protein
MLDRKLSRKGRELVALYEQMFRDGYDCVGDDRVEDAFADFELRPFREPVLDTVRAHHVSTVLDFGCGGSDWHAPGFDEQTGKSALEYFGLQAVYRYEPARNLDERQSVDCVVCFDVLEHVFITDVPGVIRDMLSYATKLVVLNVACYPARALLPNGENAHITVRHPMWWKGVVDCISLEFPSIDIFLMCSTSYRDANLFPIWNAGIWQESDTFVIDN